MASNPLVVHARIQIAKSSVLALRGAVRLMFGLAIAVSISARVQAKEPVEPALISAREVPALIERIQNGQSKEKLDAMLKLRGARPTDAKLPAVHAVVELLKHDADVEVRIYAAEELGFLPSTKESSDALFAALDSRDQDTRWKAANSAPGGKAHLKELLKGLNNKDVGVKMRIADKFQLEPVDDPSVLKIMAKLLSDEDRSVRSSAALALVKYGARAATAEPALIDRMRVEQDKLTLSFVARALAAVGNIRPTDLPVLRICLQKEHEYGMRVSCVKAITYLGPQGAPAIDDLINIIGVTHDYILRGACADAFAAIGPAAHRAAPALVAALTSPKHDDYRYTIAAALGVVATKKDKPVVEALQQALQYDDPVVQDAARQSLIKLGVKPDHLSSKSRGGKK